MISPYYELPTKSNIVQAAINEAMRPDAKWVKYYNFDATSIHNDVLALDPVLADIGSRHPLMGGVVMLPPHTFYNWHRDTRRGVSLNMVLNPQDGLSHCVFTEDKDAVVGSFTELKYKPDTWYLFNTQVDHMVINFDAPRVLLTVEFGEDKDHLTFDDLLLELL